MTRRRYFLDSFWHYRRSHLPTALGVAVATAVITGALVVGDSVRGSLRELTNQRLGRVDYAIITGQPFRAALADDLAAHPDFEDHFSAAEALFQLRGSLNTVGSADGRRYAGGVAVFGVTAGFDRFGDGVDAGSLASDELAITAPLATELGVLEGDEVLLRLPTLDALPADSPLGEKVETTLGKRLTVARILPPDGLARFSLYPSQEEPTTVFLSLATVQQLLGQPGKANTLLVAGRSDKPLDGKQRLAEMLRPSLEDYGVTCERLGGATSNVIQIESTQLVLGDAFVSAVAGALKKESCQLVATYLANSIRLADDNSGNSIPYSIVTGVDSAATAGPLLDGQGQPIRLTDNQIALNEWAAKRLGANVGDQIVIRYYLPESTHGQSVEAEPLRLTLQAIVPLAGAAADPRLTPVLQGVTDADSIDDWDLPFELVEQIERADEDYWDAHTTTPKAYVSFALAKRLWATRWGSTSLIRIVDSQQSAGKIAEQLRKAIDPGELGFGVLPVKKQGLAAAAGTTPFEGLFLGFSLFLIASAVMLVGLLFGLAAETRAAEVGLLSAVGWQSHQIRGALLREGLAVAALGSVLGMPIGVAYASLMIWGLTTAWVEAIVTPFLTVHVTTRALAIGSLAGLVISWLVIRRVVGQLLKVPERALLAGQRLQYSPSHSARRGLWVTLSMLLLALGLAGAATTLRGEAQAGAFFGSGAGLLGALVWLVRGQLLLSGGSRNLGRYTLNRLAWRNLSRNPGRSLLTIGLVASASFLILAIGAFRLAPTEQGTAGFLLVGQSSQALAYDLNTDQGRLELGFSRQDEEQLNQFSVQAFRVHDGEDASCLNLYQTQQPRVLGLPDAFVDRGGFEFADSVDGDRPWNALRSDSGDEVPVILDFNTAMYSLKLYGGVGSTLQIRDEADQSVTLRVVGLLKNSLLQGDLLVSEANFLRMFPSANGSRFFLIEAQKAEDRPDADALSAMLESRLSDYGMDLEAADRRLAGFLAVQNTYLTTFQTVGALGLLLGVVGVAVVQLRNMADRRSELALLQAGGFRPNRLRSLVLRENLVLLGTGLSIGAVAAVVALVPQAMASSSAPASLPWLSSGLLIGALIAVGVAVGGWATSAALRASIVPALRGD